MDSLFWVYEAISKLHLLFSPRSFLRHINEAAEIAEVEKLSFPYFQYQRFLQVIDVMSALVVGFVIGLGTFLSGEIQL